MANPADISSEHEQIEFSVAVFTHRPWDWVTMVWDGTFHSEDVLTHTHTHTQYTIHHTHTHTHTNTKQNKTHNNTQHNNTHTHTTHTHTQHTQHNTPQHTTHTHSCKLIDGLLSKQFDNALTEHPVINHWHRLANSCLMFSSHNTHWLCQTHTHHTHTHTLFKSCHYSKVQRLKLHYRSPQLIRVQ